MSAPVRLSEQFSGFAAVELTTAATADALGESLRRFGPVQQAKISSLAALAAHLSPVKSFTTTYAVAEFGAWSLILTDMKGENCNVNAFAVSRAKGCRGIAVTALERRRQLHIYEQGQKVRSILSLDDEGEWYYSEEGEALEFETPSDTIAQPKSRRLPLQRVRECFEVYTGLPFPEWGRLTSISAIGVARSVHEVRVEIVRYETLNDLLGEPYP
jgi:hypothetical protein